jgi:exonuclease VII large subunit
MKYLPLMLFTFFLSSGLQAQPDDMVRAHEAIEHRGEYAMVCGVIAGANYLKDSKGGPTYLNFDKPYPDHDFSAIIFKKNRKNFKIAPETLTGYKACVYGKVKVYKGKAQVELVKEQQLSVRAPDAAGGS